VDPLSRGSRLDADHPENGVLIPCRFTRLTYKTTALRRLQCLATRLRNGAATVTEADPKIRGETTMEWLGAHWFEIVVTWALLALCSTTAQISRRLAETNRLLAKRDTSS
jgi:hypothetical protein